MSNKHLRNFAIAGGALAAVGIVSSKFDVGDKIAGLLPDSVEPGTAQMVGDVVVGAAAVALALYVAKGAAKGK